MMNWRPDLGDRHPLYLAIVEALAEDIASGKLPQETRLPTHRELADALGVAVGTVTRAYDEAESRGLIHGEGRRGTFVGRSRRGETAGASPFAVGSPVTDLGRYFPAVSDDPDLSAALKRLSRSRQTRWLLQYTRAAGLERHRRAGADWLERLGLAVDPDSVVLTSGAQHAMTVVLSAIAQKGDLLLAESHTYPGLQSVAALLGVRMASIAMDEDGLLPEALDAACARGNARALYINPTLQNPTNATIPEARRRDIAAIAEKHGLFIIEDEVNRALVSAAPPPVASFAPERTFLVGSVSKILGGGLRVCYVGAPPGFADRVVRKVCATIHMVSPILLEIAKLWIDDGTVDATVAARRREAAVRQQICQEALGRYDVRAEREGYTAWLTLPGAWNPRQFAAEARARGILVLPADDLAVNPKKALNAVRISLGADLTRDTLRAALTNLAEILAGQTVSPEPVI